MSNCFVLIALKFKLSKTVKLEKLDFTGSILRHCDDGSIYFSFLSRLFVLLDVYRPSTYLKLEFITLPPRERIEKNASPRVK